MRERTFEIDRMYRGGTECLVEGVKYPGDPHRRCRLTVSADGFSYRVEGHLSPLHAAEVAALLPRPHAGIDGIEAGIVGYGAGDWRLTVEGCPPFSCLTSGATYPVAGFGVAEPMAADPDEEVPELAAPRFRH
ncbi:hypothetical protein [Antarcticirhabdus aurantiaca]|uniref:Uncharacterized protein n=1 Tax=Antarcticirhabdus aurantiaca TaxID=2606717 RepID=A0ACD4NRY0_9HYPH|nr:hypothetical protein [Antarcticirhabdus aurantiaca]WAJ29527.1 hypothetical protein OXU80_04635 [Jeongeuplla avenae]